MAYFEHDDRVKFLATTLRSSGMAMSESEALRMAQEMCATEAKVSERTATVDQSAAWNVGRALQGLGKNGRVSFEDAAAIGSVPNPTAEFESELRPTVNYKTDFRKEEAKKQNGIEMIEKAENPEPINVQVYYETPQTEENKIVPAAEENITIPTAEETAEKEIELRIEEPKGMPEKAPEIESEEEEFLHGAREIGTPNTEKGEYNTPIRRDADPTKFAESTIDLASVFRGGK